MLWSAWSDGVVAHCVELITLEVEAAISSFTDLGPPQTQFTRSCVCRKRRGGTVGQPGRGLHRVIRIDLSAPFWELLLR